jgi:hypothetical protein
MRVAMSSTDWPVAESRASARSRPPAARWTCFPPRRWSAPPGGRVLHAAHQLAQLLHRVVHRVGDGAGDVLGHRGFLGQIAFGDCLQFVHQPQNGRLVGIVDALGFLLQAARRRPLLFGHRPGACGFLQLHIGQAHRAQATASAGRQHQRASDPAPMPVPRTALPAASRGPAQRLAVGNDRRLRSRADTRPCRLPRMPLAWLRVCSIQLDQRLELLARLARRVHPPGAARRCPPAGPGPISLKEFRSLPSRNTASG